MSVEVHIHPSLQYAANDEDTVEVSGSNVGECLRQLVEKYPGLEEWLYEKNGKLSKYIDVFVNQESSYPEELNKPVKDGDKLNILMQIAGG